MISYLCNEYIALAVSKISNYMRLTEATAGKTLVPLANGATDIITVVIATMTSADDYQNDIAIGSLFGASLFTTTVILCFVIFYSSNYRIENVGSPDQLEHANIEIDLGFFIGSIVLFIVIGALDLPSFVIGLSLAGAYVAYLVVILRRTTPNHLAASRVSSPDLEVRNRIQSNDSVDPRQASPGNVDHAVSGPALDGTYIQGTAKHLKRSRIDSLFDNESVGLVHSAPIG